MNMIITIGILSTIGFGTIGGLRRGVRRELLNIVGVLVAIVGGIMLAKPVASLFNHYGVVEELPYLLAFLCGFIAVSLGFSMFKGPFIPKEIDTAERMSGGILGFLKGVMFAGILLYLLVGIWPGSVERITEVPAARLVAPVTSIIDAVVGVVTPMLPEEFTEHIRDGFQFFKETREELGIALDNMGEIEETTREYARKVQEGAAVVDSLAGALEPPPAGF
ncbi:CvpA family protein [Candidatus Zixiibacteriota bacterium]